MVNTDRIVVATNQAQVAIDVTEQVLTALSAAALPDHGVVLVTVPHTTCAITLSEVDDELLRDIVRVARELLAPFEPFEHARNDNPNARAHITASLFGASAMVPIRGNVPVLGTYQRLVLIELDGPKDRHVHLDVLGV